MKDLLSGPLATESTERCGVTRSKDKKNRDHPIHSVSFRLFCGIRGYRSGAATIALVLLAQPLPLSLHTLFGEAHA